MVCKHCGSQLSIADKKCPFCGMENTAAAEHHEAMSGYQKRFDNTRTEVLQEVKKSRKMVSMLVVIALLAALNVVLILVRENSYGIEESLRNRDLDKKRDVIEEQVEEYIVSGNYSGLYGFFAENKILYISDGWDEYDVIGTAANVYHVFMDHFMELQGDYAGYQTEGENLSRICTELVELYELVNREYRSYRPELYDERAVKVVADVQEKCETLLCAYCGLGEEELDKLQGMDQQQMEFFIGGRIGLYE